MLLPMVAGMMVSSITTGQLVSKFGRYKPFIIAGFSLATLSILALTTLDAATPYWHQAVIMAAAGLGLGMAMPILSLAVQNEFEQKDLGAATSSVQLFRGLGSTVGTALFSGMLTLGILSSMGTPSDIPYVQTLQQSPAASQLLGTGDIDADVLLQLNGQKANIREQAVQSFAGISNQQMRVAAEKTFIAQQDSFTNDLVQAFTDSLHSIFLIGAGLMATALCAVTFIKNKELRSGVKVTAAE